MVFYADIILLLNLVIDYFILLATAKILNLNYKPARLISGAGIGAVYSLVFFIQSLSFFHIFLSKILLSLVIVWLSFGFKHLFLFIQTLAVFYVVSFVTGGGVLAFQYLFNIEHTVINGIYVSKTSSPFMVISIIVIVFFAILLFSNKTIKSIKRKNNIANKIIDLKIIIGNHSCECRGLIDTGNQLYDPITRKPVMVIEAEELSFLPPIIKTAYQKGEFRLELFNEVSEHLEENWLKRINFVPFRTVLKGMSFLLTIRPDKVVITTETGNEFSTAEVLVGLDYGKLSNDRSYQAIIHPELIAG